VEQLTNVFFAVWNSGPFNYHFLFLKLIGNYFIIGYDGEKDEKIGAVIKPNDLCETLLQTRSKREMERRKLANRLMIPFYITALPFLLIETPFIFLTRSPHFPCPRLSSLQFGAWRWPCNA